MGLYNKYHVVKANGEADDTAEYFVLRIDKHGAAEMAALRAFACHTDDESLRRDLLHYLGDDTQALQQAENAKLRAELVNSNAQLHDKVQEAREAARWLLPFCIDAPRHARAAVARWPWLEEASDE